MFVISTSQGFICYFPPKWGVVFWSRIQLCNVRKNVASGGVWKHSWALQPGCLSTCTPLNKLNGFMWKSTGSGTSGAQFSFDLMSPLSLEPLRLISDTNKTAEEMSSLIRAHIFKKQHLWRIEYVPLQEYQKVARACLKVNLLKWKLRVWSCKMHVDVDAFQDNLSTTSLSLHRIQVFWKLSF